MRPEIIDMHVHFGAPPDQQSGCYWSPEFEKSIAYYAMMVVTGSLFKQINVKTLKKHISGCIDHARYVDKCVLLALDRVHERNGKANYKKTHLFTPNDFIIKLCRENSNFMFGCSVHPYRRDSLEELDRCMESGAVLCKWIPSSQQIDLEDSKCIPFYKKLAEYNLPLLCHAGPEHAVPPINKDQDKNNPALLKTALDLGVTVIVAHCAMPFFDLIDKDLIYQYREFIGLCAKADERSWKLYGDLSAVCTPTRKKYVEVLKEIVKILPEEKLLYGSDYPVPIFNASYKAKANPVKYLEALYRSARIRNPLDRNYKLVRDMGFSDQVFTNFNRLISNILYPH